MGNRQRSFFGRPAFAALVFGLGLALFSPPLLGIPAAAGGGALWIYLFAAWAGLIAALFGLARSRKPFPPGASPHPAARRASLAPPSPTSPRGGD